MIRRIISILVLMLILTSCGGGAPAATQAPATEAPAATEEPAATEPPALPSLGAPTSEPPAAATSTAPATQIVPTLTDTALPTLELPTEAVNAPARLPWDGTPTYPGESTAGYAFRVRYDPDLWGL